MSAVSSKKEAKSVVAKIHPRASIPLCPVRSAMTMLMNNAVTTTVEIKGSKLSETQVTYPPELLAVARGLFPAGKEYPFEIHASGNLATIGGGVFNTVIYWSPANTSFAEWTALSALFDEVVLWKSRLELTSAFGPTSTAIVFQVVVAPDPSSAAGATPSFTVTQRLAESEVIHPYEMGRGAPGRFVKLHKIPRGSRPFATTAVPGGATGTPSGCLGQWNLASNIVGTASINYMFHALKNTVVLRNRA